MPAAQADSVVDPNDPHATRIAEATATVEIDEGPTLAYCEFGDPAGVVTLVNYHKRDADEVARRHGGPIYLPEPMERSPRSLKRPPGPSD